MKGAEGGKAPRQPWNTRRNFILILILKREAGDGLVWGAHRTVSSGLRESSMISKGSLAGVMGGVALSWASSLHKRRFISLFFFSSCLPFSFFSVCHTRGVAGSTVPTSDDRGARAKERRGRNHAEGLS